MKLKFRESNCGYPNLYDFMEMPMFSVTFFDGDDINWRILKLLNYFSQYQRSWTDSAIKLIKNSKCFILKHDGCMMNCKRFGTLNHWYMYSLWTANRQRKKTIRLLSRSLMCVVNSRISWVCWCRDHTFENFFCENLKSLSLSLSLSLLNSITNKQHAKYEE